MWWIVAMLANAVIGIAYLAIATVIARSLLESKQVRANKLGTATALIFFTCAIHHAGHAVGMALPLIGAGVAQGRSLRDAFGPSAVAWDLFGAAVAVYYWSLRATYGPLMRGAKLFEDLKDRQRQALEINDNIVQGLTVAHMALEVDDAGRSREALEATLASARRIISDLLGDVGSENALGAGDLVRSRPAVVVPGR